MNCSICGQPLPCPTHSNDERTATSVPPPDTRAPARAGLGDEESLEPTSKRDALVGRTLGEYEIRRRVGEGGMGVVYEGFQPVLGRRVAIKFVRREQADTPDQIDALLAEARTSNLARHRHIIDVFGFGKLEGFGAYLVMEYLEGVPLDEYLTKRGSLTPLETIKLLDEVLSALSAAHARGVIHRDLKPSNVFLVEEVGTGHYAKLLDFGLAKAGASSSGPTPQTHSGMIVGTPEYMAPEQALGKPVSPKTDLYAVGIMAFEMLTGRLPFPSSGVLETAMHHVNTMPSPVNKVDPSVPAPLSDLVGVLLAKDPDERPDGAEAVRARLKQIQRQLMTATTQNIQAISVERTVVRKEPLVALATPRDPAPAPATPLDPTMRPRGRAPAVAAVAAVLALLAGGAFWATRTPAPGPTPVEDPTPGPEPRPPDPTPPPVKPAADPKKPTTTAVPDRPDPKKPLAATTPDKPEVPKKPVGPTASPDKPTPTTPTTPVPAVAKPEPAPAKPGRLKFKIAGWGSVSIDGKPMGTLPHAPFELPPGRHRVEVADDGDRRFTREVEIKSNEETFLSVTFDGK